MRAARAAAAKRAAEKAERERRAAASSDRSADVTGSAEPTSTSAAPVLLAGLLAALMLLGVAMTPAWAVPWRRAARVLDHHREQVAALGGLGLFATALFFFFVTFVAR